MIKVLELVRTIMADVVKYGEKMGNEITCRALLLEEPVTIRLKMSSGTDILGIPTNLIKVLYTEIDYFLIDGDSGIVDVRRVNQLSNEYTEIEDNDVYPVFKDSTGDYFLCYKNGVPVSFNHESFLIDYADEYCVI